LRRLSCSPILTNAIVYLSTFPFIGVVLLREIWAKGWFVPEEPEVRSGVPMKKTPPEPEPIGATRVLRWSAASAGVVAFARGPVEVKAAVIDVATIGLLVWFRTAFDYR
jgi:hypothetical protein